DDRPVRPVLRRHRLHDRVRDLGRRTGPQQGGGARAGHRRERRAGAHHRCGGDPVRPVRHATHDPRRLRPHRPGGAAAVLLGDRALGDRVRRRAGRHARRLRDRVRPGRRLPPGAVRHRVPLHRGRGRLQPRRHPRRRERAGGGRGDRRGARTDGGRRPARRPGPGQPAGRRGAPPRHGAHPGGDPVTRGALSGLRVLDLSRLAPGPYCSMLLADLGADVVMVGGGRTGAPIPVLRRGKHAVELDLKSADDRALFDRMVARTDVLIESFRPGVAARLGADHERLSRINPRIVSCSLTGYGQDGALAQRAGHDINYLAVAGALGTFGRAGEPPTPPLNLLADFGGGGLLAAFGILAALHERERSGVGQHVDAAMVDGVLSMMAMPFADWGTPKLPERGTGVVTGTLPAYRTYECAQGRYVAVGALEPQFFAALWRGLGLDDENGVPDHLAPERWDSLARTLEAAFRTK